MKDVPDHLKAQEICNEAASMYARSLVYVLDYLKTQDMCDKAFWEDTSSLQYFPDWFVTQQEVKSWHDDYDYCDDDEITECYEGYNRKKAQKAQIKKELMCIACLSITLV